MLSLTLAPEFILNCQQANSVNMLLRVAWNEHEESYKPIMVDSIIKSGTQ